MAEIGGNSPMADPTQNTDSQLLAAVVVMTSRNLSIYAIIRISAIRVSVAVHLPWRWRVQLATSWWWLGSDRQSQRTVSVWYHAGSVWLWGDDHPGYQLDNLHSRLWGLRQMQVLLVSIKMELWRLIFLIHVVIVHSTNSCKSIQ